METIGQRLLRLRRERGLTQESVAQRTGVTRGAVCQWEGGTVLPNYANLVKVAAALEVSASTVIEGTEENSLSDAASVDLALAKVPEPTRATLRASFLVMARQFQTALNPQP